MLKKQIENVVGYVWLFVIHSDGHGLGSSSTIYIPQYLYQICSSIRPGELKANEERIDTLADQLKPMMLLFKQLEDEHKLVSAAGAPFITDKLVNKAEQLILAMGKYGHVYHSWVELITSNKCI